MAEIDPYLTAGAAASDSWRRLVLESALDAVIGTAADGTVIDWNRQAEAIFGYSKAEALGRNIGELILTPAVRKRYDEALTLFLQGRESPWLNRRVELEAVHASGRLIPVELSTIPVPHELGHIFYSFLRNIADRIALVEQARLAAWELEKQREHLYSLFMQAPLPIAIMRGPELVYELSNPANEAYVGPQNVVGKRLLDVFPDYPRDLLNVIRGVYASGNDAVLEEYAFQFPTPEGVQTHYMSATFKAMRGPDGKVEGVMAIGQDVTKSVLARKRLEESEQKLRLITDAAPALISYIDKDLVYQFVNRVYEEWFGLDRKDVIGRSMEDVLGPKAFAALQEPIRRALRGEASHFERQLAYKHGGSRWVYGSYMPDIGPDGQVAGFAVLITDISEQKGAQDNQRFKAELSERLARLQNDPDEMLRLVTQELGERFSASRCWVSDIDERAEKAVVANGYASGFEPLRGEFDLGAFGPEMVESWRAGRVVRVDNVHTDSRTRTHARAHSSLGIESFVTVPLLRHGHVVAALNVTKRAPYRWSDHEVELIRAVTESLWSAVENARLMAALRHSEEHFRRLAEAIPQIVWTTGPGRETTYINGRWKELTGETGVDPINIIHADDWPHVIEVINEAFRKNEPYEAQYRLRDKNGNYRWHLGRSVPLFDQNGQVIQWFGSATDIHQQKQAEEAQAFLASATQVLISTADFQQRLEQVACLAIERFGGWCSISLIDESGEIREMAVAHRDPEKLAWARSINAGYKPDLNAPAGIGKVIRTGEAEFVPHVTPELLLAAVPNETRRATLTALGLKSYMCCPLRTRRGIFGAITIVGTDRVFDRDDMAIAEELARRFSFAIDNARLVQDLKNAVASRDDFISIASHELKTPITSLKLQTQIFSRSVKRGNTSAFEPEKVQEMMDTIDRQANRLSRLVEEMLDISRIANGKLPLQTQRLELAELVRTTLQDYAAGLQAAGSEFSFSSEGEVFVNADRERIAQVLGNLLSNTIKYGEGRPVELRVWAAGVSAFLSVRDSGMGIPKDKLEKVFEKFERAVSSSNISGLGLGLFISRQIVELHGGRITATSEPGAGSTFTVELQRVT
ncbi:MAG TPA: PAS domain S-box protein [Bdellovibrionales bacterium]|nr:PAS domain S-box protein [Bdellovibrionales bacterium]